MKKRQAKKAFTLVELLIVIAIIGVLASFSIPKIIDIMRRGPELKSMAAARAIAQAWNTTVRETQKPVAGADIHAWAFDLAKKANFNDPASWILEFDPAISERGVPMPANVGIKAGSIWSISEEFKSSPLSWEVSRGVSPFAAGATPLVWTRGLKSDGTWDRADGVFADQGGHIAYADASVKWYTTLRPDDAPKGVLRRFDNETLPTFNINDAVKGGASNILKSQLQ